MSLLKITKLNKSFGDFKALTDISLTVKPNEVYGFIGRNGAGKTTTINIILSLITKDSGTIFFNDKEVTLTDTDYKYDIGFVPDVPSFPTFMNAQDFLSFTYDTYQLESKEKKRIIDETLKQVGLFGISKNISKYSRGMKQRLAIGSALLHRPKLLIMDEPTSALDPIGRKDVLDIILTLKKSMAIFYSTHILEDAQKVCDRIGLIENGKIILEDTIEHLTASFDTYNYYVETNNKKALENCIENESYVSVVKEQGNGFIITFNSLTGISTLLLKLDESKQVIKAFMEERKQLEDIFIEVLNENNHSV